eukprot:71730-Pyramimonas_sp.AAC.1
MRVANAGFAAASFLMVPPGLPGPMPTGKVEPLRRIACCASRGRSPFAPRRFNIGLLCHRCSRCMMSPEERPTTNFGILPSPLGTLGPLGTLRPRSRP